MRIYYHSNDISITDIERLKSLGAVMVDVKDISLGKINILEYPYFWRFFSFFDDEPALSRDLDSRVSFREVKYIENWLRSGLDYFAIRDHPWQDAFPAGLVGMRNNGSRFKSHFVDFINSNDIKWGSDQDILREYMKHVGSDEIYYCGYNDPTNYIPRDDKCFFIGMQMDENDLITNQNAVLSLKCLEEMSI